MRGKRKNRPGRGSYMDLVVVQNLVIDSFTMRPCKLEEKYGCSHGVASRALSKARSLGMTEEAIRTMTPKEFSEKWYRREVRGKVDGQACDYLQPDYAKMQEMYAASREHGGSGTCLPPLNQPVSDNFQPADLFFYSVSFSATFNA